MSPGQHDALAPDGRVGNRGSRQQCLRVGMPRTGEQGAPSRPSRRCAPRYITATRSEMCPTTARSCAMNRIVEPEPALQLQQQVDHLRLHRHVERGDRLVRHQQLGLGDQRAAIPIALALAARELVRIAGRVRREQADELAAPPATLSRRCAPGTAAACIIERRGDDASRPSCAG